MMDFEITRANESGVSPVHIRWMVETPTGWIGAWDRDAIEFLWNAGRAQGIEEGLEMAAKMCEDIEGYENSHFASRCRALKGKPTA
jgi:hypothetical protein